MRYYQIPELKVDIPVIGQGCGKVNLSSSLAEIEKGVELGMTLLDTAEVYSDGESEQALASVLSGCRDKIILATKVSPENLNAGQLVSACEKSLKRLATDSIDLYQIHWPNNRVPIEETMEAMANLTRQGKIRSVGVCNFSLKQLKEAEQKFSPYKITAVQAEYNLLDRSAEWQILPYCRQSDKLFIGYSPLVQGKLTSTAEERRQLKVLATKYKLTESQIVLCWLTSGKNVTVIPKAAELKHVIENATAGGVTLDREDIDAIAGSFPSQPLRVSTERIRVVQDGVDNRQAYRTLEEAMENRLEMTPSPLELAEELKDADMLKPVRLRPTTEKSGQFQYDLVEGRLRFWAWVIAHKGAEPIPALVRN